MEDRARRTVQKWFAESLKPAPSAEQIAIVNRNGQQMGGVAFMASRTGTLKRFAHHMRCTLCGHGYYRTNNIRLKSKCTKCQGAADPSIKSLDGKIAPSNIQPIRLNLDAVAKLRALLEAIDDRRKIDRAAGAEKTTGGKGGIDDPKWQKSDVPAIPDNQRRETLLREDGFMSRDLNGMLSPTDTEIDDVAGAMRNEYLTLTGMTPQPFGALSRPTKDAWRQVAATAFSKRREQIA